VVPPLRLTGHELVHERQRLCVGLRHGAGCAVRLGNKVGVVGGKREKDRRQDLGKMEAWDVASRHGS
jgi:hypothetical protein